MKILFVHQNFPAQFLHLAPALAARGHEARALGSHAKDPQLPGVQYLQVQQPTAPAPGQPSSLSAVALNISRGQAVAQALQGLMAAGFVPDLIYSHPGWGESFFLRDVCPTARQVLFAEYYYGAPGGDSQFDPEFNRPSLQAQMRTRIKNTHLLHALSMADLAISPTEFQRSQHPDWVQPRMKVVHDGIDTQRFKPNPKAVIRLRKAALEMRPGDEVVTFVSRQLEPYRGYHIFMRCLPLLLRLRPQAQVLVVGGDGVSYGAAAPAGKTWKQIFHAEVASQLPGQRVHFVGRVPHELLTQMLQVSAVHVYLTYPFVLSWSLLEAMSMGCLVVGSRTAPLQEVVEHGRNGLLTDFFDHEALAHTVADALERRTALSALRLQARQDTIDRYDLHSLCLPQQLALLESS